MVRGTYKERAHAESSVEYLNFWSKVFQVVLVFVILQRLHHLHAAPVLRLNRFFSSMDFYFLLLPRAPLLAPAKTIADSLRYIHPECTDSQLL